MSQFICRGLAALIVFGAAGCTVPYALRVAYEEIRILWGRQSIVQVLADDGLDDSTREKLTLVLEARAFARDVLAFDVGDNYATLARVDGDAVVHVVTAAYRDRLEAYTWRYPVVGRVPYRGFFDQSRAQRYAAELEARGLDTAVWPSAAFSTLGWFADPLLSNMLEHDPVELMTVVFHELTHVQLYVPSAAEFNESLANFVGHRAATTFFCGDHEGARIATDAESPSPRPHTKPRQSSRDDADPQAKRAAEVHDRVHEPAGMVPIRRVGRSEHSLPLDISPARCALAEARWHDEQVYAAVLVDAGEALRTLYATALSPELRDSKRATILATATRALTDRPLITTRYHGIDFAGFNNAVLVQQLLYRHRLTVFDDIWQAHGQDLGGAVQAIIDAVEVVEDPFLALGAALKAAGHVPELPAIESQHAAATRSSKPAISDSPESSTVSPMSWTRALADGSMTIGISVLPVTSPPRTSTSAR